MVRLEVPPPPRTFLAVPLSTNTVCCLPEFWLRGTLNAPDFDAKCKFALSSDFILEISIEWVGLCVYQMSALDGGMSVS